MRHYIARSFGMTLWLRAKGFKALGAEQAREGVGLVYLFDREEGIDAAVQDFHAVKDELNAMSTAARVPVVR